MRTKPNQRKKKINPEAALTSLIGSPAEREIMDRAIEAGKANETDKILVLAKKIMKLANNGSQKKIGHEISIAIAHLMELPINEGKSINHISVESVPDENKNELSLSLMLSNGCYKIVSPEFLVPYAEELGESLKRECRTGRIGDVSIPEMRMGLCDEDMKDIYRELHAMARDDWEASTDDEIFFKMSHDEQLEYIADLMDGKTLEEFANQFGMVRVNRILAPYLNSCQYAHSLISEDPEVVCRLTLSAEHCFVLHGGFIAFAFS